MNKILMFLLLIYSCGAYADCWVYASHHFGVEVRLLKAIAEVESGMNPAAVGKNKNGSQDYGLMQINSTHLSRLKKKGVNEAMLREQPCVSVLVGASILRDMVKIYGYGWEAVGAYNAGTRRAVRDQRMAYARKVWQIYLHTQPKQLHLPISKSQKQIVFNQ